MSDAPSLQAVWRARLTADDYPGVVFELAQGWRLVVPPSLSRYVVQRQEAAEGGPLWFAFAASETLAGLAQKVAPWTYRQTLERLKAVPGLAAGMERTVARLAALPAWQAALLAAVSGGDLPDDPAEAVPGFARALADLREVLTASDWRREDYPRVIARDGNFRVVVSPCGLFYRLQSVSPLLAAARSDNWRTVAVRRSASAIFSHLVAHVRLVSSGVLERETVGAARLLDVCRTLPERAEDGTWPAIPQRPD